jgi:DNA mismatch repair protein MutL
MADVIHLLPDSVANQIAAGEVVQRPASAVKELLENSVDAGASIIKLIVKDAGKTLLQVIDNGKGMSATDARLCFERHATSKIEKADDLFNLSTKGFRGEALASIAAIAQVELKTKQPTEDLATLIEIEGNEVKRQEFCSAPEGTSIAVKNLFYNVPARRNFLKSDPVEFRHIIEEFQRVALPHPEIAFSLYHNGQEIFHLQQGNLRQRIIAIFGNSYNERLVPVDEDTSIVKVGGFVGKPQFAKKSRGEQYFFLNNRFIKSSYLHHAIQMAFAELLTADSFASYFLLLEVDPKTIDVNIHPTKTEVKFEDERLVYSILRSAVKRALGKYNIAPTLDFDKETTFDFIPLPKDATVKLPSISVNPDYNPFAEKQETAKHSVLQKNLDQPSFEQFMAEKNNVSQQEMMSESETAVSLPENETQVLQDVSLHYQLHNAYVLTHIKTGFMIIDQQQAHERVLYERYVKQMSANHSASQQLLFPVNVELNAADYELMLQLADEIKLLGFDFSEFGKNTLIVHGIPADLTEHSTRQMIEQLINNFKNNEQELNLDKRDNLAQAMARSMGIKTGQKLTNEEMANLVNELFACQMPYSSPQSKPTLTTFALTDLERRFKK